MDRREFLKGLAATSALIPAGVAASLTATPMAEAVLDRMIVGMDFGATPSQSAIAIMQIFEDGRMAVREITGIEFFRQEPLGEEFEKVLHDNAFDLYAR